MSPCANVHVKRVSCFNLFLYAILFSSTPNLTSPPNQQWGSLDFTPNPVALSPWRGTKESLRMFTQLSQNHLSSHSLHFPVKNSSHHIKNGLPTTSRRLRPRPNLFRLQKSSKLLSYRRTPRSRDTSCTLPPPRQVRHHRSRCAGLYRRSCALVQQRAFRGALCSEEGI